MTAATSTSKKSFFGTHFKSRIIEQRKLFIVNLVLQLIGLPLISIIGIYIMYMEKHHNYHNYDIEAIFVVSVLSIIGSLLTGMLFARASFKYLYTKHLADMNYSLPLTSKQRFFADYLSGLTAYVIPAVSSGILSIAILGIGSAFVDLSEIWYSFPMLLSFAGIVLVAMILYYTTTVFVTVCCGSSFETVFGTFAVNILIPAVIACAYAVISYAAPYGFSYDSFFYSTLLTSTSPVGMIIFSAFYGDSAYYLTNSFSAMYIRWLIPSILVIALIFTFSFLLYNRRKAESISKPYVYKFFYHAIVTIAIFCILSLFIISNGNMFAGLITCGIIYFILEVISKRGFKGIWISVLKFVGIVAAVFIFCGICNATDGFGTAKYVPRAFSVERVEIEENNSMIPYYHQIKDKNVIKKAVSTHNEIIDRYYHPENYDVTLANYTDLNENESRTDTFLLYNTTNITFKYHLKNGSTVIRNYNVPLDVLLELNKTIMLSDEYAESITSKMINNVINHHSDIYYEDNYKLKGFETGTIRLYNKLMNSEVFKSLSAKEVSALSEAYKKDWIAMTEEEFRTSPVYGYMFFEHYPIRECFTNTIEFLESIDYTPTEITEEWIYQNLNSSDIGINIKIYDKVLSYSSYNSNYYRSHPYQVSDKITVFDVPYYYPDETYPIDTNISLFCKLIDAGTTIVLNEEVSGAVFVDFNNGYGSSKLLFLPKSEENDELLRQADILIR